ncbi:MAG: hypothetical protein IPM24_03395 [Bryobacterales bacterium]|nr:hypothetical protein [Bryobacterales bacterium]
MLSGHGLDGLGEKGESGDARGCLLAIEQPQQVIGDDDGLALPIEETEGVFQFGTVRRPVERELHQGLPAPVTGKKGDVGEGQEEDPAIGGRKWLGHGAF